VADHQIPVPWADVRASGLRSCYFYSQPFQACRTHYDSASFSSASLLLMVGPPQAHSARKCSLSGSSGKAMWLSLGTASWQPLLRGVCYVSLSLRLCLRLGTVSGYPQDNARSRTNPFQLLTDDVCLANSRRVFCCLQPDAL
jgi:hypothetical protein